MSKKKPYIAGVSKNLAKSITKNIEVEGEVTATLSNKRIGISVSESDDFQELGFSKTHLKDITIELTRYLLVNGAHLVYGGDLRRDGYTYAFSELAFQYRKVESDAEVLFTNYFGWPIHLNVENSDAATFKRNRVSIIKVPPPQVVPVNLRESPIKPDNIANRYYWAKSMSKMRLEMTGKCDARILIGGKTSNYDGFYPGIVEEAYLAIKRKQPVYVLGALGGAAAIVSRALKGEKSSKLVDELLQSNPELLVLHSYSMKKKDKISTLLKVISELNKLGMKSISRNNGLSNNENEILVETDQVIEMILFILLGLKRTFKRK